MFKNKYLLLLLSLPLPICAMHKEKPLSQKDIQEVFSKAGYSVEKGTKAKDKTIKSFCKANPTDYNCQQLRAMKQCIINPNQEKCSTVLKWHNSKSKTPYYSFFNLASSIFHKYTPLPTFGEGWDEAANLPCYTKKGDSIEDFYTKKLNALIEHAEQFQALEYSKLNAWQKMFYSLPYSEQKKNLPTPVLKAPSFPPRLKEACQSKYHPSCENFAYHLFVAANKPTNAEIKQAKKDNNIGLLALAHLFSEFDDTSATKMIVKKGSLTYGLKRSIELIADRQNFSEKETEIAAQEFIQKVQQQRAKRKTNPLK